MQAAWHVFAFLAVYLVTVLYSNSDSMDYGRGSCGAWPLLPGPRAGGRRSSTSSAPRPPPPPRPLPPGPHGAAAGVATPGASLDGFYVGDLVEVAGTSVEELNGEVGVVRAVVPTAGRLQVQLAGHGGRTLALRPMNLRLPGPRPPAAHAHAPCSSALASSVVLSQQLLSTAASC